MVIIISVLYFFPFSNYHPVLKYHFLLAWRTLFNIWIPVIYSLSPFYLEISLFCFHFWSMVFLGVELLVGTLFFLSFNILSILLHLSLILRSQLLILLWFFLVCNAPFCYGWLQDFVFIFVFTLLRIHGTTLRCFCFTFFCLLRLSFLWGDGVDGSSWK